MRKWGNGNRCTKLSRQDRWTGNLACENMVYSTEYAVDYQGKEGHEIMGIRYG